jgi:hypothetical protein
VVHRIIWGRRVRANKTAGIKIAEISSAAETKPAGVARAVALMETDLPIVTSKVALISSG